MDNSPSAELIAVGTEILRGEIVDTNSGFIATQLPLLGVEVRRMSTIGDNLNHLCDILRQAMERSSLIIATGGLGPTEDDLTREAIATTLGETLTIDPELEKNLRTMFSRSGREMPPHNIKQAMIIPSATGLPNPRGTAPGWWVEKNGKIIAALPGPPREMTLMWQNEVVPRIRSYFRTTSILTRTIKTFFVPEATVAQLMEPFFYIENLTTGIYAKPDGIQVRLIAHGENAEKLLDDAEIKIKELLHPYVWGKADDTLAGLAGEWLIKNKLTMSTIEDMTGGLLADYITATPESQKYYHGGLIATNNHAKISWGTPEETIDKHGAISSEVAEAMAIGVRATLATDIGISITGITGTENKQPGLVFIGIADNQGTKTWQQQYQVGRTDTRERVAIAALFRLRERMIELKLDG